MVNFYSIKSNRFFSVRPDFRKTQFCYGLKQNPQHYDAVKKLYEWFASNSKYFSRDTQNLLYALTCVEDMDKTTEYVSELSFSVNDFSEPSL